jgi:thioredoxin reductase (NADPH)
MLTVADVVAVPLFSGLDSDSLQRLAGTSADLLLNPGEWAVPEGGERALYAVLAGRIEVVKLFDGVERRLGWRLPGTIFGEVPIALGTPFPGGYRAVEPSRVMRVDMPEYYRIAAASEEVALKIGALARERMGGLQSINAEKHEPRVTLVGHRWDPAGSDLRRFLARNQVSFSWLTPDDAELARAWPDAPVTVDAPVARLADGEVLTAPSARELAARLGLETRPGSADYDVAIVGGGPAGLAAAVYGASEGLRTIVIEREAPGGQAGTSSRIENYLGFPNGISGDELASRALQQSRRLGAEILVTRDVVGLDVGAREVRLDGDESVRARTMILANGVSWRRLAIEGMDGLIGKGVYYGAARTEVGATHGQDVLIVGGGNSSGQAALFFATHARSVTLLVRGDALEKDMSHYLIEQLRHKPNVMVAFRSELHAVHGDAHLAEIEVRDADSGAVRRCGCGAVFVFIGADAQTGWLPPEIARDERGYVLTGDDVTRAGLWRQERDPYLLETSAPGVFACGDVRLSPVKRVAAAVGEGSMAIAFVHRFLARERAAQAQGRRADV